MDEGRRLGFVEGLNLKHRCWFEKIGCKHENVTIEQVIQTLQSENVNIPGGSILEGRREYLVRTLNAFQTVDDIRNIKIRRSDGVEIRLDEVAEIKEGYKERQVLSRLDGQESVELEIYKSADANIVSIASQSNKDWETQKMSLENLINPKAMSLEGVEEEEAVEVDTMALNTSIRAIKPSWRPFPQTFH